MQLPTAGKPGNVDDQKGQLMSYDATVIDWVWQGNKAMSEKEDNLTKTVKYHAGNGRAIRRENGGPFGLNRRLGKSPGRG